MDSVKLLNKVDTIFINSKIMEYLIVIDYY